METGAALEGKSAGTEELAADVTGDAGSGHGDGVEEFDPRTSLDTQKLAFDVAHDFAVTSDEQVSRAIDGTGELSQHGEMVALDDTAGNHAAFKNDHIAAGLNSAVPRAIDLIVE